MDENNNQQNSSEKKYGPLLGIVIIVGLLVIGGLYLAGMEFTDRSNIEESDPQTEQLKTQGSSDELEAIEADLEATDTSSLDAGSAELEGELTTP